MSAAEERDRLEALVRDGEVPLVEVTLEGGETRHGDLIDFSDRVWVLERADGEPLVVDREALVKVEEVEA